MRRALIVALVLVAAAAAFVLIERTGDHQPEHRPVPAESDSVAPTSAATPSPSRTAGRLAPQGDPQRLLAARQVMGAAARESHCGPYELLTDVAVAMTATEETCRILGRDIERIYSQRLGVEPIGDAGGTVILFRSLAGYRRFGNAIGHSTSGHGGYSLAARGLVILHAESDPNRVASTLTHELAHLLHRRTFGPNLSPWLAEGLADAVGDTASAGGFGPLVGFSGFESQARRLRDAYGHGAVRRVADLVTLERDGFDRGNRSVDYELSAALVRFLFLDSDLAPRFRSFLRHLGAGEGFDPGSLFQTLTLDGAQLDALLAAWLIAQS